MAEGLLRQIEMLRMLPRQGKITPQQLQRQLENVGYPTTERTVQRDLQTLSAALPIECDDKSRPHGWRWSPGTPVWSLPGLALSEALAFQLLQKFNRELLPAAIVAQLQPYFVAAREQIEREIGAGPARNWLKKIRSVQPQQPLLPPAMAKDTLASVHEALLHDCCLRLRYGKEDARERIVHPLGLIQDGLVFYLVVNYDGYPDVRLIAVHRIRRAEVLTQKVQSPKGFDLDRFIDDGGMGFGEVGKTIRLELKMSTRAGRHLKETPLSQDQVFTELDPDTCRIKATVQLTPRLRWWLLGFGGEVEVLAPTMLRDDIRDKLTQALDQYAR